MVKCDIGIAMAVIDGHCNAATTSTSFDVASSCDTRTACRRGGIDSQLFLQVSSALVANPNIVSGAIVPDSERFVRVSGLSASGIDNDAFLLRVTNFQGSSWVFHSDADITVSLDEHGVIGAIAQNEIVRAEVHEAFVSDVSRALDFEVSSVPRSARSDSLNIGIDATVIARASVGSRRNEHDLRARISPQVRRRFNVQQTFRAGSRANVELASRMNTNAAGACRIEVQWKSGSIVLFACSNKGAIAVRASACNNTAVKIACSRVTKIGNRVAQAIKCSASRAANVEMDLWRARAQAQATIRLKQHVRRRATSCKIQAVSSRLANHRQSASSPRIPEFECGRLVRGENNGLP